MQKVIAIVGPTASGKTALGIFLAKKLRGEVISADSRQIYRGMDIIAAVPSKKEMAGVPHHMLRIADPKRAQSAGEFAKEGARHLEAIEKRGRTALVVGGTGFYVDALLSQVNLPEVPPDEKLRRALQKKTPAQLLVQLKRLDPRRAKELDPHNKVRIIRAIEIAKALGRVPKVAPASPYDVLWLGLAPEKEAHRRAIRARAREHVRRGMLMEVKRLRARLPKKRFEALGAEFLLGARYLDGALSKDELAQELERWEMKYAKRQMRWLKRNRNIRWLRSKQEALSLARRFLARK